MNHTQYYFYYIYISLFNAADGDYTALTANCVFSTSTLSCQFCITIRDDNVAELDEYFSILLNSNDPSACQIQDDNITATIIDDGK